MDPFSMVVLIVLIMAIASVAKSVAGKGHSRRRTRKAESGDKYDYQAWSEGQRANERQTKKELELFKLRKAERDEARKLFERVVMEKLDVMKTAISMGMDKTDLEALDSRLEKLIGREKLESLINEDIEVPEVTGDLLDTDLQSEIDRLQQRQAN